MRVLSICLLLSLMTTWSIDLGATHNRAGEIIYEQTGPLTITATIKTYTKNSSSGADRDSLELFWGDGTSTVVVRTNGDGNGEIIPGDVKINCYTGEHTYAARATYTLSFMDPNRVTGILNVNFPNSVDIPFYLETTFTLLNVQFQGLNNSVVLLDPPLDFACKDKRFIHNPNAFDIDGDSIGYELIVPFMGQDEPVPNYVYPDGIIPGLDNVISLDPLTGDFVWDSPKAVGEYNIAIQVNEFRNGQLISSTIRDMQIFVDDCDDNPPIVESDQEICVIAGELLDIPLLIDDIDPGDQVKISGSGGPFIIGAPIGMLDNTQDFMDVPFDARFTWQTTCDHAREQYYQIVIRAEDLSGLVEIHTIRIKVIAPPPLDPVIDNTTDGNLLTWESPYLCDAASSANFLGFSIWRKDGSNPFEDEECDHGMEGRGYTRIEFTSNDLIDDRYQYTDTEIEETQVYCYRVTAIFAKLNVSLNPINVVESKPSEEVCILAKRDIPYLTQATVLTTSTTDGSVTVEWLIPDPIIYDTVTHVGPYTLTLTESSIPVGNVWTETYAQYSDIPMIGSVTVDNLNTEERQHQFEVTLSDSASDESPSQPGTTVFLTTQATDMQANLSWTASVPWENITYRVYRSLDGGTFELIETTNQTSTKDQMLDNGTEYCYYIQSEGTYGIDFLPDPIINDSQVACVTPLDNLPPCPPSIAVLGICEQLDEGILSDDIFNELSWNPNLIDCPDNTDIAEYTIYVGAGPDSEFTPLTTVDVAVNNYTDDTEGLVGGCYYLIAIDSVGNLSMPSDTLCLEKCSIYELPNTFTPNADGANDLFVPRRNLFVESVDFRVFNKWGDLLYQTTDPQLNWNGTNLRGREVDDGTYYYTCELFQSDELGVGIAVDILSGYIEVLR